MIHPFLSLVCAKSRAPLQTAPSLARAAERPQQLQLVSRSERCIVQVDGRLVQRPAARQAEQVGCDAQGDSPQREGRRLLPFARALPPARRAEGAWCAMCDV